MESKRIFLAVTNDLITDNRIHKVASTLLKAKAEVTLIGRVKKIRNQALNRSYKTRRFYLLFKKGPLFYLEYNIRLLIFLLFNKFDIVVANDLDTLLASYLASKIKRKAIVYDSHEYFTEVPELVNRNFPKKVWLFIEKRILPQIKYSYTVSESIAEVYHDLYRINMQVVRNVPYRSSLKNDTKLQSNNTILYQGALNKGRGLEQVIDAMQFLDNKQLIIVGSGDIEKQLKERVRKKNLQNKVEFKGRICIADLAKETIKADLGIALEENIGLSYYYSLPNKLFDYIQALVPVLVSPFPEMQKIVRMYDIGTICEHKTPKELAKKINEIFENKNVYKKWKSNTILAAKELSWENEEQKLICIYNKLGLKFE